MEKGMADEFPREHPQRLGQVRNRTALSAATLDEELQWIALEVHDRIAQILASAFQQLQMLESITRADPQVRQVVVRASLLLREAIRECRDIMKELHPPGLKEFGLIPLMEEELRQFQEDTGCETSFEGADGVRRSGDIELTLYRIFHEALINARRHAPGATKVRVSLTSQDSFISFQIEDNGDGFDFAAAREVRRVGGLMSMQRRAELIHGTFEVTSIPKQGNRVRVCLPFERRQL